MENTNQRIAEHFSKNFGDHNPFPETVTSCKLTCIHSGVCRFDEKTEASFSGALGDPDTKIMLVAESPSTGSGVGAYYSGTAKNLTLANSDDAQATELMQLLEYIKEHFGSYPYFTDWVKCGLSMTNQKSLLNKRKYYCVETHLRHEIEIMQPDKIICLGNDAHKDVYSLIQKLYPERNPDEIVVKLTHFSRRASLPLSIADKKNIIWKLELGLVKDRAVAEAMVLNLSHLKKKLPDAQE